MEPHWTPTAHRGYVILSVHPHLDSMPSETPARSFLHCVQYLNHSQYTPQGFHLLCPADFKNVLMTGKARHWFDFYVAHFTTYGIETVPESKPIFQKKTLNLGK